MLKVISLLKVPVGGRDETGKLLEAIRGVQHSLVQTVSAVRVNAESVTRSKPSASSETPICHSALKNRPARWNRPLPRWVNWVSRSGITQINTSEAATLKALRYVRLPGRVMTSLQISPIP
ncbi:hypothetical protein WDV93_12440 [Pantoea ananatis]